MSKTEESNAVPVPPMRSRGPIWARRIALVLAILVATGVGYGIWRNMKIIKLRELYAYSVRMFGRLGEDMYGMWAEYRVLPPSTDTEEGPVIDALNPFFRTFSLSVVLSEQSAINLLNDPYFSEPRPLRYWSKNGRWTAWTAGPDLDYDLMDPELYAGSIEKLKAALPNLVYDPTNGLRSSGDLIMFDQYPTEASQ